ncbi:class I SAM-dependent methyltransferase [Taibaiella sp. KBW10]|uniref:class I SAM-dependent methyltransferase n=1 Tax=Taibaiella sp. KBW10 TaxID=2153357 RepID=UPI000F5B3910|nr:class I SAM-dependent methyltransferase [Taibaiella sp. KBW10]RQO30921.1 class I SAM-dependent methyltransferase [Taibaiella sp. KBW10]
MHQQDSTNRFSNRVSDYKKYRPHYPKEIVLFLQAQYGLSPQKTIADIGAGTGISSLLFLELDYTVIAVEPNAAMRAAASADLKEYSKFSALDGTAEHTLLPDHSVDAVVAAQAFHWFDKVPVRKEFQRILKPDGYVVLIWNERLVRTEFEQAYDQLILKYAIDYVQISHRNVDYESIKDFFAPNSCTEQLFANQQLFDFEGLKGRLLSSSYMPKQENPVYEEMINDLKKLFAHYQQDNKIRIGYETKVYVGSLRL